MLAPNFYPLAVVGLTLRLVISAPVLVVTVPEIVLAQEQGSEQDFGILKSADLAVMLQKKDFLFINVHVPYEGEIANTDILIPYNKIAENLDKLPKDKSAKIVLYCRSGRMSEIAAQTLVQMGYSRVSHLAGGMNDWKRSGYQIIEK